MTVAAATPVLILASLVAGCTAPPPALTEPPPAAPPTLELTYSCGGPPGFAPALLDRPANAETEEHPSAAALRAAIAEDRPETEILPASGYWLVSRDDRFARYIARGPVEDGLGFVSPIIETRGGGWELAGAGGCLRPGIVLDGLNPATWVLDPAAPAPDAAATTFTALVTEGACTSGQPMGGRLLPPSIDYGVDAILVVFAARPLAGGADCQGNPATRAVVQLREPLGDRRLLDASVFPPMEPLAPES